MRYAIPSIIPSHHQGAMGGDPVLNEPFSFFARSLAIPEYATFE
jgi:hypothetical protein